MADLVAATITLGGILPRDRFEEFCEIVAEERLSAAWDGEPFSPRDIPISGALTLMASEVAWGGFDRLEAFCEENALPFARWHQSNCASWAAERAVFTGNGEVRKFPATDDDTVTVDLSTIDQLGTIEAIRAHFDEANFPVPPFRVG